MDLEAKLKKLDYINLEYMSDYLRYFERNIHENKDGNNTIGIYRRNVDNLRAKHPREQGLKHYFSDNDIKKMRNFERNIHENKDGNCYLGFGGCGCGSLRAKHPREQGLKHLDVNFHPNAGMAFERNIHENKDGNNQSSYGNVIMPLFNHSRYGN